MEVPILRFDTGVRQNWKFGATQTSACGASGPAVDALIE